MDKQRLNAGRGKCARASNGISPFEENTSGQAPAFCRSRKMRPGKQRQHAGRQNPAGTGNGILPFEENAPGQAPAFCRSRKTRRDKHRHFAVRGKCTRTDNGKMPVVEFRLDKGKHIRAETKNVHYVRQRVLRAAALSGAGRERGLGGERDHASE
ncbi:MAG: hypothetical protein K2I74_07840, partial [Treponemataceae bacterium]|nr:hypothetical protein [Treponemataceae bacterium]